MKVVLPEPAMPTQTMDTAGEELVEEAIVSYGGVEIVGNDLYGERRGLSRAVG